MIVDAFLEWSHRAPRARRIEAADALARSFLHSQLDEDDRRKVLTGLLALVDDPCADVRARLAAIFADRRDAPRAVVLALLDDVPGVSAALFARSPLVRASHLGEALARGEPRLEAAIAGRPDLPEPLVDQIIAGAGAQACIALVANPHVRLAEPQVSAFIERFAGDSAALDALQANRRLAPVHQCMLVAACAQSYQANEFVRAFVPGRRLERLTQSARERALVSLMSDLDPQACWQATGSLYARGVLTPAFVLRVALCGQVVALEAVVAWLCDVPMERVRSAFVHPRPVVAASLLSKTGLGDDVRAILSMALVLARELARSEVDWTPAFFAETLVEVIDQRHAGSLFDGPESGLDDATIALCHSIAADILQAQARTEAQAGRACSAGLHAEQAIDVLIEDAVAA